jgi:hypothetical protein
MNVIIYLKLETPKNRPLRMVFVILILYRSSKEGVYDDTFQAHKSEPRSPHVGHAAPQRSERVRHGKAHPRTRYAG